MADFTQYTNVDVYINGKKCLEAQTVSIARNFNNQEVKTIAGKFAGVSQGAPDMTVDVDSAVPSADFEFLPKISDPSKIYEFTLFCGGRTLTCNGYIENDNFSKSHENAADYKFQAKCQPADFVSAF